MDNNQDKAQSELGVYVAGVLFFLLLVGAILLAVFALGTLLMQAQGVK